MMKAPAMSATPHIAAAHVNHGGRTERRLHGADSEIARWPRPTATAANLPRCWFRSMRSQRHAIRCG